MPGFKPECVECKHLYKGPNGGCACDTAECINQFEDKIKKLEAQNEKLKAIGKKYSTASEWYDQFVEGNFIKMREETQKLVNQIGKEILEILKEGGK